MAPLQGQARVEYDRLRYLANKEERGNEIKARKAKNRSMVQEIKTKAGCSCCGCKENLHFHHKDKETKEFNVSDGVGFSWERITSEIDKCIILCSTCHANHHHAEASRLGANRA